MSTQGLIQLSSYLLLILPSFLLFISVLLTRKAAPRKRLLFLLIAAPLALALLILALAINPYGRELSSSLLGFGMLPVLVALLVMLLKEAREIPRLWSTYRAPLVGFLLLTPLLFALLWLYEATTFYYVTVLTAVFALAWLFATRASLALLAALSLISLVLIVLAFGGSFKAPLPENPTWLHSSLLILGGMIMILGIFLSAALLYTGLRGEEAPGRRYLGVRLLLVALLIGGSAYQVFWDGVWSSAHARAFEDHLPFMHFLTGLIAAVMLVLALPGWRRLAGPAFLIALTTATTFALILGWRVSAFALTEERAARVETAIARYHQEHGRFPAELSDLTPDYLLYLPPPVVVRQAGWCYQGDEDFYRLGYVSGSFTYFEADFITKIFSQAGRPPEREWACDEWIARFEAGETGY
jgi:hypothetical protein